MFSKFKTHIFPLKLAAIATVIVMVFATATAAFAQVNTFTPCVAGRTAEAGETYTSVGTLWAQTRQYNSGCENLTVVLRRWSGGSHTDVGSAGVPYTPWVNLSDTGTSNTSRHKAILSGGVQYYYTHTSSNGLYSTANWYCSGSAGGSGNCP